MDDNELREAIRAALDGEVQLVPFHPEFPELEKRGRFDEETVLYSASDTFRVQLAVSVEKKRLKLNTPGTQRLFKDVNTALERLGDPGPRHPKLRSKRYDTLDKQYGERVWQSYIQTGVPSAWRMWWFYDTDEERTITVAAMEPHP